MSGETHFMRKAGATPSFADTLPTDITDVVLKRVVALCLITAGIAVFGFVMSLGDFLGLSVIQKAGYSSVEIVNDILMIMISLGVAWIVRRRMVPSRMLGTMGLVFGAYAVLWACVSECVSLTVDQFMPIAYFSFSQAWVVFFPAIVPIHTGVTHVIILLAAAIPPLSRGLMQGLGLIELPPDSLVILTLVMAFSATMGLTVSHVVYRLGRSVRVAREMGSYTLEENLGSGGMGEVWLASHRMLARPAAVKLLKPEVLCGMQPAEIEKLHHRFEHEVQATAALCSPHTVDIYDYGLAQDGTFYYVMELLSGIDMETLVKRFGPIEPVRVVFYLTQVCHSLHEAHRRRLIHRDIKPANLFVCTYGEDFDFVKILDFGLVKQARDEQKSDMKLTAEGSVTGTPAYMYPEAVTGKDPVDHRSDIYSLGCVAYWLLTGQLVFTAETSMAMLLNHVSTEPVPPSTRSELEIPEDLDNVILACLEKEPADRPQNVDELEAMLRDIEFSQDWDQGRARMGWELHRL